MKLKTFLSLILSLALIICTLPLGGVNLIANA